jgi:hypothetical protein
MNDSSTYGKDFDKTKFVKETLVCKTCGAAFEMITPISDKSLVSPLILRQKETQLCDDCYIARFKDE